LGEFERGIREELLFFMKEYPSFIEFLQTRPNGKKRKRRSFLRVKFLDGKKCFFEMFIRDKMKKYSKKDLYRRFEMAENMKEIFSTIVPYKDSDKWVFKVNSVIVIIKELKNSKKQTELQLLSLYPK
jgi:hypothetical protein